jgi:hypothetical protein
MKVKILEGFPLRYFTRWRTKLFSSMPSWIVAVIQPGCASDWTGRPEAGSVFSFPNFSFLECQHFKFEGEFG